MTLVKLKQKPFEQNFNTMLDDFFNPFASINKERFAVPAFKQAVPVNVMETEKSYVLEVVAPSFEKEAFNIKLDKNLLTISAEFKKEEGKEAAKYIRHEHSPKSFERSFTIDENIDAENIAASYKNGVLTLNLPRKTEVKAPTKNITIQ